MCGPKLINDCCEGRVLMQRCFLYDYDKWAGRKAVVSSSMITYMVFAQKMWKLTIKSEGPNPSTERRTRSWLKELGTRMSLNKMWNYEDVLVSSWPRPVPWIIKIFQNKLLKESVEVWKVPCPKVKPDLFENGTDEHWAELCVIIRSAKWEI